MTESCHAKAEQQEMNTEANEGNKEKTPFTPTAATPPGSEPRLAQLPLRKSELGRGFETIQPMSQAQNRVLPDHPRTGITHDHFHLLTPCGHVAVDRAIGTGRLFGAKAAALQPDGRVIQ